MHLRKEEAAKICSVLVLLIASYLSSSSTNTPFPSLPFYSASIDEKSYVERLNYVARITVLTSPTWSRHRHGNVLPSVDRSISLSVYHFCFSKKVYKPPNTSVLLTSQPQRSETISVAIGVVSAILLLLLFIILFAYFLWRKAVGEQSAELGVFGHFEITEAEDLISFPGGQNLTIHDILDAPGEVLGKSTYGTVYKASLQRSGSVALLRFLRPTCTRRVKEIFPAIRILGFVRHPNLVPLQAFYSGTRGEKLLLSPFFGNGNVSLLNLSDSGQEKTAPLVSSNPKICWTSVALADVGYGTSKSHRWPMIYRISLGIAKGLDHLHTGMQKPVIHGNLKSKNVLLDSNYNPYISDSGLHLLLNPTAAQEMLEALADQGYRAPELIKMKEATKECDVYSLGVILLELLTGKKAVCGNSSSPLDHLPNTMRNAVLHHGVIEMFNPQLISQIKDGNLITEADLLAYFQLAMSCCSPSPALRPDTRQIVEKLEEIGN
ncbi:hypothetical protein ACLOJK_002017 [Asimina triloba]